MSDHVETDQTEPRSAEHDFYESLAAGQYQDYRPEYEQEAQLITPWAIIGIVALGLLVVAAMIAAVSLGAS